MRTLIFPLVALLVSSVTSQAETPKPTSHSVTSELIRQTVMESTAKKLVRERKKLETSLKAIREAETLIQNLEFTKDRNANRALVLIAATGIFALIAVKTFATSQTHLHPTVFKQSKTFRLSIGALAI